LAIEINLTEEDDRVVNLVVTDKHGEVYSVGLEFLNHEFGEDDVQVGISKLPKNHKEVMEKKRSCPSYSANTLLHNEKVIDRKTNDHSICRGVWYEFHEVDGMPAVLSKVVKT
jgi:hypothetical protein